MRHHSDIKKTSMEEMNSSISVNTNAALDYCYVQNEMFDTLVVNGWAYNTNSVETTLENKQTELYICSTSDCYKIACENYIRQNDWKPNGFGAEVSLLGVSSGTYRLYIKNSDNQFDYGICATPYLVKVNSSGIEICNWNAAEIQLDAPLIANAEMQYDPGISVENDSINLWGWAYLKEKDAEKQNIIIQLQNTNNETFYYSTDKVRRDNIASMLKDSRYLMSGFQTSIQMKNAANSKWSIRLLIEEDELIYTSPYLFVYEPENNNISWKKASLERVSEVTLNDRYPMNINYDLRYDPGIAVSGSKLSLYGWACILGESADKQSVIIAVTDEQKKTRYYMTEKTIRKGVAEYLNSQIYEKCGFSASIDVPENKPFSIKIIVNSNDQYHLSAHTFYYNAASKEIIWKE